MSPPKVAIKKAKMGEKAFKSLGTVEQTLKKGPIFPALIIISAVLYSIMLVFSSFAANPKISYGLFNNSIANVSNLYPLNITPAGWTFSIWGIIYLLQIGSTLYSLGLLCRQVDEQPAYLNPVVLSPLYFVFFSLSSLFVSGWLFMWDRLLFFSSSVFLLCCVMCLWTAFSIASERLSFFRDELLDRGRNFDVSIITLTVVNGLGMYATWSVIATLLNTGVLLVYRLGHPLSNETASIVCLSCVALFLALYSCLDMILYEKINRYTFSPYLTIIWAMAGIISDNLDSEKVSSIMSVVLLGCGVVALFIKIGMSCCGHMSNKNPYRRMKINVPED